MSKVVTVFERVPDRFVELYDAEFQRWAANYSRIGRVGAIKLKRPVAPLVLSADQRQIVGVRLTADVDKSRLPVRVVIRPQTDADEEAIKRHVVDMAH